MQHHVIFDTDIATDPDDLLALALLLGSPEVDLLGITTVHADVDLRARYAQRILQLHGTQGIPVHSGLREPLLRGVEPYWEGHEGRDLLHESMTLPPASAVSAVPYLVETVLAHPDEITLLALGPLTNVAAAMIAEPRFASSLKRLVIMGGIIDVHGLGERLSEHNIWLDPEAAHVVFSTAVHVELIPIDVTERVAIDMVGIEALLDCKTPFHTAIANQTTAYHRFQSRGQQTFLHDPLAALAVLRPELLSWHDYLIRIELTGCWTRGMTASFLSDSPNASVAMGVDVTACQQFILDRLLAEPRATRS